ncbi:MULTISPECIES: DUF760 domain-containing protein [Roseofilum]|uniref:DUF760 domain-containing protein n=1 Tax=Roseofilum reptotaenium AO1-A TaxID=1925591 RepID=A0A1L9QXP5_9CYAN|nr:MULTISPECIES: DUF760 domain-containing protein [Roseofilum]OJJ27458.1 hypothetical protein BI308_00335 [Roseofilum reptotaenium AO1-A]HBR00421.1 hypothetical protein [Cyanobacteria bacterium UBA11691]MBP0007706.1 DUF760 domain-containing protein [Roseofilum sp. Belize Diploria]MBP0012463.1 DUF760 domain-containing protein [Roseofilum sp. SID3]MBP0025141.1 DUF760 domain-containing protein [Roseofilum sp. SID2]
MNPNIPSQHSDLFEQLANDNNVLGQYLHSLDPEAVNHLSQPSKEALSVMEHNIVGLLGHLPPDHFGVTITTSREQLGRLLASAMMTGYFLHKAETRMGLEEHLANLSDEE